ncbi:MAG: hypothetical protein AB3N14_15595, partial [Flavobacteriaceae bacterium]
SSRDLLNLNIRTKKIVPILTPNVTGHHICLEHALAILDSYRNDEESRLLYVADSLSKTELSSLHLSSVATITHEDLQAILEYNEIPIVHFFDAMNTLRVHDLVDIILTNEEGHVDKFFSPRNFNPDDIISKPQCYFLQATLSKRLAEAI